MAWWLGSPTNGVIVSGLELAHTSYTSFLKLTLKFFVADGRYGGGAHGSHAGAVAARRSHLPAPAIGAGAFGRPEGNVILCR